MLVSFVLDLFGFFFFFPVRTVKGNMNLRQLNTLSTYIHMCICVDAYRSARMQEEGCKRDETSKGTKDCYQAAVVIVSRDVHVEKRKTNPQAQ